MKKLLTASLLVMSMSGFAAGDMSDASSMSGSAGSTGSAPITLSNGKTFTPGADNCTPSAMKGISSAAADMTVMQAACKGMKGANGSMSKDNGMMNSTGATGGSMQ